jgi:hypothetical protein
MPYRVRKCNTKRFKGWTVEKQERGRWVEVADHSTEAKAQAQVRLLRAVEHGWKATRKR